MSVGVVIIGRNEGERFERCLRSLVGRANPIIYVDSGSTDQSVAFAESFASQGVHAVRLDMTRPFTAARARNAGLDTLLALAPTTQFVQFVDGDCEVRENWLHAGEKKLREDPTLAAVSGRLRERFPEKTLYNRLADLEWDRPPGEEKSCGGVAMMRIEVVRAVGGFDPTLIAGEEPELCARMRARGFRVWRLTDEMAWHDIDMTTRKQWLTRARRHGYAIIEVSYFKTQASRGLFAKQVRSAVVWGIAWPVVIGLAAMCAVSATLITFHPRATTGDHITTYLIFCAPLALCVFAWLMQWGRIALASIHKGLTPRQSGAYAYLLMRSKSAQASGMARFLLRRFRKRSPRLIDYRETS